MNNSVDVLSLEQHDLESMALNFHPVLRDKDMQCRFTQHDYEEKNINK